MSVFAFLAEYRGAAVIREVPGAEQVAAWWLSAHDYTDPAKPKIARDDEQARAALVDALVTDALNLLGRLPERELGERAANGLGLLALVAGQDVEPAEDDPGHEQVLKPPPLRSAVPGRFTSDNFRIDLATE